MACIIFLKESNSQKSHFVCIIFKLKILHIFQEDKCLYPLTAKVVNQSASTSYLCFYFSFTHLSHKDRVNKGLKLPNRASILTFPHSHGICLFPNICKSKQGPPLNP